MAAKSAYRSCGCGWCRGTPSKFKGEAKREAHRRMRRLARRALRRGAEPPPYVSTGALY